MAAIHNILIGHRIYPSRLSTLYMCGVVGKFAHLFPIIPYLPPFHLIDHPGYGALIQFPVGRRFLVLCDTQRIGHKCELIAVGIEKVLSLLRNTHVRPISGKLLGNFDHMTYMTHALSSQLGVSIRVDIHSHIYGFIRLVLRVTRAGRE